MKELHVGFSLIELMVYCMALAIVAIFWSRLLLNTHNTMSGYSMQSTQLAELYSAYDVCLRDIHNAPVGKWCTATPHKLIWRQSDTTWIGLVFEDNKLIRYEGSYNPYKNIWMTHKKSLLANGLNCLFKHTSTCINIQLCTGSYAIEREIYV